MKPIDPGREISVTLTAQEWHAVMDIIVRSIVHPYLVTAPLFQKISQRAGAAVAQTGNGEADTFSQEDRP